MTVLMQCGIEDLTFGFFPDSLKLLIKLYTADDRRYSKSKGFWSAAVCLPVSCTTKKLTPTSKPTVSLRAVTADCNDAVCMTSKKIFKN